MLRRGGRTIAARLALLLASTALVCIAPDAPARAASFTIDGTDETVIGTGDGTSGTLESPFTITETLSVGKAAEGRLTISEGGRVESGYVLMGEDTGSSGTIIVTGAGSTLNVTGILLTGENGGVTLSIEDGGRVETPESWIGFGSGSENAITVSGAGSTFVAGNLSFGLYGNATLTVASGGTVSAGTMVVAEAAGSSGTINIGAASGAAAVSAGAFDAATVEFGAGEGTIVFNHTDMNYEVATDIKGTGGIEVESGTTILTGANTYSGTTTISGGTLQAGGNGALSTNSDFIVNGGTLQLGVHDSSVGSLSGNGGSVDLGSATLTVFQATDMSYAGSFEGSGSLRNLGAGQLTLTGNSGIGGSVIADRGTLAITGSLASTQGLIGSTGSSNGAIAVSGSGASWINAGEMYVGMQGAGTLSIEDGGLVQSADVFIGHNYISDGDATVRDTGSIWMINGTLQMGKYGTGTLTIEAGGRVETSDAELGWTGTGTVMVNGAGSTWINSGDLNVGNNSSGVAGTRGVGVLTIGAGGTVEVGGLLTLASTSGSLGTLNIGAAAGETAQAAGSLATDTISLGAGTATVIFNHTDTDYRFGFDLVAGSGGSSILHLAGVTTLTGDSSLRGSASVNGGTMVIAGTLESTTAAIGSSTGSDGTVVVSGADASWANAILYVGGSGTGSLTIENGGVVTSSNGSNSGNIGTQAGSKGTVTVTGTGSVWTNSSLLNIGTYGEGNLTIAGGGSVSDSRANIALGTGSSGAVTVSGGGSSWVNSGNLNIGYYGHAALTIEEGGAVSNGEARIGEQAVSEGSVLVTGEGSSWMNGFLFVGFRGTGTLEVLDGATVTCSTGEIGWDGGSSGTTTIAGIGSSWTASSIYVGNNGDGKLTIADGGRVDATYGWIGYAAGSTGAATVTGAGSSWIIDGIVFDVGSQGSGTLNIEDGGLVSLARGIVGGSAAAEGIVTVTGVGSILRNSGKLDIGYFGTGTLSITDGGAVENTVAKIGYENGSSGTVTVSGEGSNWTSSGYLDVGYSGTGNLTIADGGTVSSRGVTVATQWRSTSSLNIGAVSGETAAPAGMLNAATLQFGMGTGSLVFNHTDTDYEFGSKVGGRGTILNEAGVTKLTGDYSAFSGSAEISGGTLAVNTSFNAALAVLTGGTLGGNGTVSQATLASGATVAPGNSVGTLNVSGDLDFVAGTTYAVEVNDGGTIAGVNNDLLAATGTVTIDSGATVTVGPENGTDTGDGYALSNSYTILTAGTLVDGTFGSVTDGFAFLDASLSYDANTVYLNLLRNNFEFASVAETPNQAATADGIESLGSGQSLYTTMLGLSGDEARAAYDQLSGEIHASIKTALIDRSRVTRDIITDRIRDAFDGVGTQSGAVAAYGENGLSPAPADTGRFVFWSEGYGGWSRYASEGNAAAFDSAGGGLLIGGDALTDSGWRFGLAGGYSHESYQGDAVASTASADSYHLAAYGGSSLGPLGLRFGASYSRHDIETSRTPGLTGFTDTLTAEYGARTWQAFAEASWRIDRDLIHFEPFANLAWVDLHSDGFTEMADGSSPQGAAAALTSKASKLDAVYTTLGARVDRDIAWGGRLGKVSASAAWLHAFGDTAGAATMAFAGGDVFAITGVPLAKDAALVGLGLAFEAGPGASLSFDYSGQFGKGVNEQGGRVAWRVLF